MVRLPRSPCRDAWRMLAVLLIATVLSGYSAPPSGQARAARMRVTAGRVAFARPAGVEQLTPRAGARVLGDWNLVELGSGSAVRLSWPHLLTLDVRESSSFEVRPGPAPALQMLFFGSVDVELRRGTLAIQLPQGWELELERCALYLRELADGSIEVVHRGGLSVRIRSRSARGVIERGVPRELRSGTRLILPLSAKDS